jgi:hypothetical protein
LAAAGKTEAPPEIMARLQGLGHVTAAGALTAEGSQRADGLKPFEHDLRLMFSGGRAPIRTVGGGAAVQIGGGPATIR